MKFLCLIYGSDANWAALPDEQRAAVYADYQAFADEARSAGALLDGAELQAATAATTVRVRNGDLSVLDGPYAETKEQLGGYFLLECKSLEEAVALASKIPAARHGKVEVRAAVGGEAE